MSDIVKHEPQQLAIPDQLRYAEVVTDGDMVPQAYRKKPANALLAIGLGQAMGLNPAESLYRIDVIQGKPTASAELIAANVRRAGHKLRVAVDEANTSVTATIFRADDPDFPHSVTRDMAWAQKMGLNTKENYKKQPLTMLQWRAISAVARLACSEALYGVNYTPDELSDMGESRAPQRAAQPSATDRLKAAAQPDVEVIRGGSGNTIRTDVVTGEVQEPEIPEDVLANVARAKADGNLPAYLDYLIEKEAPAHIITYVKEQK